MADDAAPDVILRHESALWVAEIDGELVVYHRDAGVLCHLDLTAARIWRHLDGRRTLGHVAAQLSELAGADEPVVLRDVLALAELLLGQSLLVAVGTPERPQTMRHAD